MRKIAFKLLYAVLAFSIFIPKAGVKIGELPVSPALLLFVLLLGICGVAFLGGKRIAESDISHLLLITVAYFSLRILVSGVLGEGVSGWALGLVVSPLMFFVVMSVVRTKQELQTLMRMILWGFVGVCAYALAQLVFGIDAVTIPGVTVNLSDYQAGGLTWYLEKHNRVGDGTKIFSTYQNGNILGVNLLLLFPLAYTAASAKLKLIVVPMFIGIGFATLSRSVWGGIAISLLFLLLARRPRGIGEAAGRVILAIVLLLAIPAAFVLNPGLSNRLLSADFDSLVNLAGRTPNLVALLESSVGNPVALLFGPMGLADYEGGAFEITIAATYMVAGLVGVLLLTAVVVVMITSLARAGNAPIARAVLLSVTVYVLVSVIEGAFWLPPTALLFWAILGIGAKSIELQKEDAQLLGSKAHQRDLSVLSA